MVQHGMQTILLPFWTIFGSLSPQISTRWRQLAINQWCQFVDQSSPKLNAIDTVCVDLFCPHKWIHHLIDLATKLLWWYCYVFLYWLMKMHYRTRIWQTLRPNAHLIFIQPYSFFSISFFTNKMHKNMCGWGHAQRDSKTSYFRKKDKSYIRGKFAVKEKLTVTDLRAVCTPKKEDRSVITADGAGFSFSPSILCSHFFAINVFFLSGAQNIMYARVKKSASCFLAQRIGSWKPWAITQV